jgi:hypothetical protein
MSAWNHVEGHGRGCKGKHLLLWRHVVVMYVVERAVHILACVRGQSEWRLCSVEAPLDVHVHA